jgi:hypothetical protein
MAPTLVREPFHRYGWVYERGVTWVVPEVLVDVNYSS